jgi:KipI family sensor histidine kinase inhibitor
MRFLNAGDSALVIEFGNEIAESINRKLTFVVDAIDRAHIAGVRDMIPTYRSIMVNFDPLRVNTADIKAAAEEAEKRFAQSDVAASGVVVEIPVVYGGEYGPDLDFIVSHTGLSADEVIRRHSAPEYLIYMIGFVPGFTYLGGLPKELATPRLATPRQLIPGGSVGIAGEQTGIYPMDSPGGWQLMGRTPLKVFDAGRAEPFLLAAGQYLKFVPVGEDEYKRIAEAVAAGSYEPKRRAKEAV